MLSDVFLLSISLHIHSYVLIAIYNVYIQVADYKKRVSKYELLFETLGKNPDPIKADIEERCFSYLICDHSRNHFVSHNVSGYLPQKVISFIEIMRTDTHSFYLSRYSHEYCLLFLFEKNKLRKWDY